ncbi:MAG: MoxR family ATPase [Spirochaetes bacterium]|nr:MoxR family ATPase [Spirochaetota bacterium]
MIINEFCIKMKKELKKVIVGQDDALEQIILAFLASGHVILEGVPGLAKTVTALTFSKIIGLNFNRIQFTPDLMPSDILGTMIYNLEKSKFIFKQGPVFTNILLGDEINRASPKTQSALLEVMQERQVTMDGVKYPMTPPFMVIATQNPIEFEGTYPLPEAQLDRFMMKIIVDYPNKEMELEVLQKFQNGFDSNRLDQISFEKIEMKSVEKCQNEFQNIKVETKIIEYIQSICASTRSHNAVHLGVSTRAAVYLLTISKYFAAAEDRDYVIPDDVKKAAFPVLRHRIILSADAEIENYKSDDIIRQLIEVIKVPR